MRMIWPPLIALVLFIIGWQCATVWFDIPSFLLPSPLDVLRESADIWPRIRMHTWATIKLTLIGYTLGCSIGVIIACSLHPFQRVKAFFDPLIIITQNIPIIVLGPLIITWLGIGLFPKVLIIILVCFFPIAIAMTNGLKQTDGTMLNYMHMIGASRWQVFTKLEFPHALPALFSGLKISATYSVLGAVMSEWIGSDVGIGKYLILQQSAFKTDRMFIAIAIIVMLSLLLFSTISLLERVLIKWRRSHAD